MGNEKNYGKEYEGVIRSTFIISPDGKIAEAWSKVKVRVKRSPDKGRRGLSPDKRRRGQEDRETRHVDIVKERLKEHQDE